MGMRPTALWRPDDDAAVDAAVHAPSDSAADGAADSAAVSASPGVRLAGATASFSTAWAVDAGWSHAGSNHAAWADAARQDNSGRMVAGVHEDAV